MDTVSQWFPPLTNREVLTILLGCAIAITTGLVLLLLPFQRRIRTWAAAHGYDVVKVQALDSYRRWWDTAWRVTVRDQSGRGRVAVIHLVGFLPFPDRIDVQWEGDNLTQSPYDRLMAGGLLRAWLLWIVAVALVTVPRAVLLRSPTGSVGLRISVGQVVLALAPPVAFTAMWIWRRRRS